MKKHIARLYNRTHWFSDADAWMLFRLAAFTEAIGWTLLISAIASRRLGMHGVFFLCFFVFLLVTARSMAWGPWRIVAGLAAGNVPYASVVFERIMAWHRRKNPVTVPTPIGYMED